MEIGSFYNMSFPKLKFINKKSEKNDLFFVSGRNAITFILKSLNAKRCLLPNYLCGSVHNCFSDFDYYKITNEFQIDLQYLTDLIEENKYDLILIINFFGYIDKNIKPIKELCKKNNILILEDFTHNLFSNKLYGDICVCSYRKTLPTPFGSIVKIRNNNITFSQHNNLNFYYLYLNTCKILGSILKNFLCLKFLWRPLLVYCENNVNNLKNYNFDYINYYFYNYYYDKEIKNIRINNIFYLKKELDLSINPIFDACYFTLNLKCKNKITRDNMRKFFIDNKIYCPIYWPLDFDKDNKCNISINETILSIPIDQRYTIIHMKYIINVIKSYNKQIIAF